MAKRRTRVGGGGRKSKQHHTRFGDGGTKKRKKGALGAHRYDPRVGTPKKDRPKRRKPTGKRRKLRFTIRYDKPRATSRRAPSAPSTPRTSAATAPAVSANAPVVAAIARSPRVLVPKVALDLAARSPTIARALARVTAVQACPGGVCPIPTG